jgi:hypothetical protein
MKAFNWMITLLVFVALAGTASAYVDATVNFNTPNVEAYAYNCANSDCSEVSDFTGEFLSEDTTTTGQITIRYPSTLHPHGYAVHYVAEGYVAMKDYATWHSYGDDHIIPTSYNVNFFQKAMCSAVVDEFQISNTQAGLPVVIDMEAGLSASTQSAFSLVDTKPRYVPEFLKQEYYGVDTRVELEVRDSYNNVRTSKTWEFKASNDNAILADEQVEIQHTWTPTVDDDYTAIVKTTVIDDQCSSTVQSSASKEFVVFDDIPRNQGYTIINDIALSPDKPQATKEVTVSYTKISNYANDLGVLRSVPTRVDIEVTDPTGEVVYSDNRLIGANADTTTPTTHSFRFTPQMNGQYNIVVEGVAESTLLDGLDNPSEKAMVNFQVSPEGIRTVTFQIVNSQTGQAVPGATVSIAGMTGTTDNNGIVSISGITEGNRGYSVSRSDYRTTTGSINVQSDLTVTVPLVPTSNIPSSRHTATFNVVDEETQLTIRGAVVKADGVNVLTDTNGRASFADLDDGTYTFKITKEDYETLEGNFVVAGKDINIHVELELEKARRGAGSVKNLAINSIRIPNAYDVQAGEDVQIIVNFENNLRENLDARAVAFVPELGIRASVGPFDLDKNSGHESKRITLQIPEDAQPGNYWVRITVGEGSNTRIVHRELMIR